MSSGLNNKPSEMPTWVTDWTVRNTPRLFTKGRASRHVKSKSHYRGAGTLSVTGISSANVQQVLRIEHRNHRLLIADLQRVAHHGTLQASYTGGDSLLTAYCNTICANDFTEVYFPSNELFPQYRESLDFLSMILQTGKRQVPGCSTSTEAEKFLSRVESYCENKSFIKTSGGYIGLARRHIQPGDLICVLLGCQTPMLLRPTSDSRYQVLGSCYVHGLMDREAFLGPLPEDYQIVSVLDERVGTYK